MKCQHCGREAHVCARPGCGHNKLKHNGNLGHWHRHGAFLQCYCIGYIESADETLCREEKEKEQRWPVDALAMLKSFEGLKLVKLDELIRRGERIINRIGVSLE